MADPIGLNLLGAGKHSKDITAFAFDHDTFRNHYSLAVDTAFSASFIVVPFSLVDEGPLWLIQFVATDDFYMMPGAATISSLPGTVVNGVSPLLNPTIVVAEAGTGTAWGTSLSYTLRSPAACNVQARLFRAPQV